MIEHILLKLSAEMIAAGIIGGIFLFILAINRPEICFALSFPAYLFLGQLGEWYPVSNSAAAAIFPWIAAAGYLIRGKRLLFGSCEKVLIILGLWMVYSIRYSMYPEYGTDKVALFCFLILPIIVFAPQIITSIANLHTVVVVMFVSMVIYVLASILLLQPMGVIEGRIAALADVTRAGQYLGLAALLSCVYFFMSGEISTRKLLYACIIGISILLLLMTGTRAAFLALIFALFFINWFIHESRQQIISRQSGKIYAVIIGVLIIALIYYPLKNILPEDILRRFTTFEGFFSMFSLDEVRYWQFSRGRVLNYFSAIEAFFNHPFRGTGAGGYIGVLGNYIILPLNIMRSDMNPMYPHNVILEFAVEQGVVGLTLFVSVLYMNFRMILRLRKNVYSDKSNILLICSCVGLYFYGLVLSMTALDTPRMMILWWGMGLLIAADRIYGQPTIILK